MPFPLKFGASDLFIMDCMFLITCTYKLRCGISGLIKHRGRTLVRLNSERRTQQEGMDHTQPFPSQHSSVLKIQPRGDDVWRGMLYSTFHNFLNYYTQYLVMFVKKERGQEKEEEGENSTALGHISPREHILS